MQRCRARAQTSFAKRTKKKKKEQKKKRRENEKFRVDGIGSKWYFAHVARTYVTSRRSRLPERFMQHTWGACPRKRERASSFVRVSENVREDARFPFQFSFDRRKENWSSGVLISTNIDENDYLVNNTSSYLTRCYLEIMYNVHFTK